jgi:hypothetical protein
VTGLFRLTVLMHDFGKALYPHRFQDVKYKSQRRNEIRGAFVLCSGGGRAIFPDYFIQLDGGFSMKKIMALVFVLAFTVATGIFAEPATAPAPAAKAPAKAAKADAKKAHKAPAKAAAKAEAKSAQQRAQ